MAGILARQSIHGRLLNGNEICIIVWPVHENDPIQGCPSVYEYTDRQRVELFVEHYKTEEKSVSLNSLLGGGTIASANGEFVIGARKGAIEQVKQWAIRNHPNPKVRSR